MNELLNNEYRLGEIIGTGAEADVFEAFSTTLKSRVALKIFKSDRSDTGVWNRLLALKGNYLGSCATLLDLFEHNGQIVAVMELLDGIPLKNYIDSKDWSMKRREDLATALITTIVDLHGEGLVHGDLSPSNVFVCSDGKIKLIDPRLSHSRSRATVFGTPNHAAPELMVFNSSATFSADIFSLSTLLYLIFEGHDPFGCQSPEEYVLKVGTKTLAAKPFIRTPPHFRRLITAGLDPDPRSRPGTIQRLAKLKNLRSTRISFIAGVLLLLSLVAAFVFTQNRQAAYDDMIGAKTLKVKDSDLFILENVGKAPFYLRQFPGSDKLVVCNAHSPYLSLVNLSPAPALAGQISLNGHHSHDFVPYQSGQLALVSSSVTDSIVVLDLKTLHPVKILGNEPNQQWFLHPDAVAISEENSHAYVTSWRGNFVTVIDLKTLKPIKKIDVSPGPSGAAISPDGQSLYVSHTVVRFNPESRVTEGIVTVINTKTNTVAMKIPNVGKESSDVKIIPETDIAITANFRGQSISLINTSGQEKISNIALNHGSPIDQIVSRQGPYIFVANFNHPYIHVVNYKTAAILIVLESKHFGLETNGISLSKDERYLCITNTESNQVVCIKNRIDEWERLAK